MLIGPPAVNPRPASLWPRLRRMLPALGAAACAAPPAWAQFAGGASPLQSGGGLRSTVESLLPNAPTAVAGPEWTYGGSITVNTGLTDNPGGVNTGNLTWLSIIQPDVHVTGNTRRLTLNFDYSPIISFYGQSNQNYVTQNLNGSATAIVVPDLFFVDTRAYVTTGSRFGGVYNNTSQVLSRDEAVQTASFSVTPYLQERFDGWGTGKVGYSFTRTSQGSDSGAQFYAVPTQTGTNPGYGTTGNLSSNQEFASFITGENLYRVQNELDASATQYSGGSSIYRNSYSDFVTDQVTYAVSHAIYLLASVGYEDIKYNGVSGVTGYSLSDATWSVGTRLQPNPDSQITVRYGHLNGATDFNADASYTVTPRIRLTGTYSDGVTTGLQQQQNLLNTSSVGANGLLLNSQTGAPIIGNSGFGFYNSVNRAKVLTLAAYYLLARDSFSAQYVHDNETALTNSTSVIGAAVGAGASSTSDTGTIGWQHDLNANTNLFSSVSVGSVGTGLLVGSTSAGTQNTFAAYTSLTHSFTETLSGSVSYSYYERSGATSNNLPSYFGGNSTQNTFLVGLRKSF